jgi:hypothetical protein
MTFPKATPFFFFLFFWVKPIYVHLFLVFTVLYMEILLNIIIVILINIISRTYHVSREPF